MGNISMNKQAIDDLIEAGQKLARQYTADMQSQGRSKRYRANDLINAFNQKVNAVHALTDPDWPWLIERATETVA
jgi:hypothetical protein